jgi:hypothetical protein
VESDGVNPYVFLVGCPRSGTTLLGRIADAHPELAIIHETRWIAEWFERAEGLTPAGHVTYRLLERLREHPRFATLGLDADAVKRLMPGDEPVGYADFVTSLFDLYGEMRRKPLVGDKTPRYVRHLPTLSELWPRAKFVHVIRDGRDVCLSALEWRKGATGFSTFTEDPISTIGAWWEWNVRLGREGGSGLAPGLYHELRYEALVADPERESIRLCEFLEIPYDPSMLRFHEGRMRDDPHLSAKKAWKPVTPGLRSWRAQMPRGDVIRFEAVAGALLDELGYERITGSAPRRELDRAARIRETFAREVHARDRPLPRAWSRVSA